MRAANKKIFLPVAVAFLFVFIFVPRVHAQTFGGTSSSTLYGAGTSAVFQGSNGASQGGTNTQTSSASSAILQNTAVKGLVVVGVATPVSVDSSYDEMSHGSEIVIFSGIAAIFAVGILALLYRQIRNSY